MEIVIRIALAIFILGTGFVLGVIAPSALNFRYGPKPAMVIWVLALGLACLVVPHIG